MESSSTVGEGAGARGGGSFRGAGSGWPGLVCASVATLSNSRPHEQHARRRARGTSAAGKSERKRLMFFFPGGLRGWEGGERSGWRKRVVELGASAGSTRDCRNTDPIPLVYQNEATYSNMKPSHDVSPRG